jgi:hypothetical protein
MYFFIELAIFGHKKMEVDPETWPLMAGLISEVWVSDRVPFPETQGPVASNSGPTQISSEPTVCTPQQFDWDTGLAREPSVLHNNAAQSAPNLVSVQPDSNQATGQVEQAAGFDPPHDAIPATLSTGHVDTHASSNLSVEPSNPARFGERIRDKWRRIAI